MQAETPQQGLLAFSGKMRTDSDDWHLVLLFDSEGLVYLSKNYYKGVDQLMPAMLDQLKIGDNAEMETQGSSTYYIVNKPDALGFAGVKIMTGPPDFLGNRQSTKVMFIRLIGKAAFRKYASVNIVPKIQELRSAIQTQDFSPQHGTPGRLYYEGFDRITGGGYPLNLASDLINQLLCFTLQIYYPPLDDKIKQIDDPQFGLGECSFGYVWQSGDGFEIKILPGNVVLIIKQLPAPPPPHL